MALVYIAADGNDGLSSGMFSFDSDLLTVEEWTVVNSASAGEVISVISGILAAKQVAE